MAKKFFALEDAELSLGDEGQLDTGEIQELNDGAEEVAVDAAEVDEIATAIEDAEVAADNLEETAEVLQAGVDSGEGVSEETAQAAEIAVEAALNMLGASHRRTSLMPSLESWGSGQSRLASTKIALEGVTDKIKEIWKKIVEFVKMVAQKVVEFFAKFFDNTERLQKAAVKIKAQVSAKGGAKPKEKNINNKSASRLFNKGNGNADAATCLDVLKTHAAVARTAKGVVSAFTGGLNALGGNMDGIGSKIEDMVKAAASAYGQYEKKDYNGTTYYSLKGTFAEGKRVSFTIEGEGAGGGKKAPKPGFSIEEAQKPAVKEAVALKADEISAICDAVVELAKATESYKSIKDSVNDMVKNTAKLADSVMKASDEAGSMTAARAAVTGTANSVNRYVTMLPAWNVAVGKAALSYAVSSISNLSSEK